MTNTDQAFETLGKELAARGFYLSTMAVDAAREAHRAGKLTAAEILRMLMAFDEAASAGMVLNARAMKAVQALVF